MYQDTLSNGLTTILIAIFVKFMLLDVLFIYFFTYHYFCPFSERKIQNTKGLVKIPVLFPSPSKFNKGTSSVIKYNHRGDLGSASSCGGAGVATPIPHYRRTVPE